MSRTRIKICGITRQEDARAAADAGVDAIGFVFWHGTPRRIAPDAARGIAEQMPPFIATVGLFVDPTEDEVRAVLARVPLSILQFHGREPPEFCRGFGCPYLKAVGVHASMTKARLLEWGALYPDAAGWLFDAPPREGLPGGTGHTFDWTALPKEPARPLVLSGGLGAHNVAGAIRTVRPWAVDVSSGVEATGPDGRPVKGIKDAAKIAAFVREVRNADA